jgi:hypothetical protein
MRAFRPALPLLGALLFLACGFFPTHHARTLPGLDRLPPGSYVLRDASEEIPARDLTGALARLVTTGDWSSVWAQRKWYPFLLAPVWAFALLAVALAAPGAGTRRRRLIGGGLLALSVGLAGLEWAYLRADYVGFLGPGFATMEWMLAWLLVVGVLAYRPRGAWRLGAIEAAVASQALLAVLHLCTLPSTDLRGWMPVASVGSALGALLTNYRPAFWIGAIALCVTLLQGYARANEAPDPASRPAPRPEPEGDGAVARERAAP